MRFFHWIARLLGCELIPIQSVLEKNVKAILAAGGFLVRGVYLRPPTDDCGRIRRVSCDRYDNDQRMGIVIHWRADMVPVSARKVAESIEYLWGEFVPLDDRALWIPCAKWTMTDRGLEKRESD